MKMKPPRLTDHHLRLTVTSEIAIWLPIRLVAEDDEFALFRLKIQFQPVLPIREQITLTRLGIPYPSFLVLADMRETECLGIILSSTIIGNEEDILVRTLVVVLAQKNARLAEDNILVDTVLLLQGNPPRKHVIACRSIHYGKGGRILLC